MQSSEAIQVDLVLLGGGHAQIAVLKSFAMRPVPGLRLTLVTDVLLTPYSGMLPAFVEGVSRHEDMHIDLVRLAQAAGARLIHAQCTGILPDKKQLLFADRPALGYDVLSINSGAAPSLSGVVGADAHSIPVKPISHFIDRLKAADTPSGAVALIGGGAASVELALALRSYYAQIGAHPHMHLISRSHRLMPHFPKRAHQISLSALTKAGINTHLGVSADKIDDKHAYLSDGSVLKCDVKFLVTPARAPDWLQTTSLPLDDDGYIAVGETLQTASYPEIFAAGDVASIKGHNREKAGVFAVRSGPPLAYNLRAFITNKALKHHVPQRKYLALISLADGTAIAVRAGLVLRGRFFWRLKKWIDKAFIDKFTNLPEMRVKPVEKLYLNDAKIDDSDPAYQAMRCLGCGAKTGADSLKTSLEAACKAARALGANVEFLPDINSLSDSAVLKYPQASADSEWLQSIDTLSQMVSDPFLFGRIAALHALSDIVVAGGTPLTALATIQLRFARQDIQQDTLIHILTGALLEFSRAGVKLVGGHTSEGHETSAGFSVLGINTSGPQVNASGAHSLILTKPLGIGVILAAQMRSDAGGTLYQAAIEAMLVSNQTAATILLNYGGNHMTDVTGFGLARHCMSLLDQSDFQGAEIKLDNLPALPGATALLNQGITSSLHALNAKNLPISMGEINDKTQLLFDPQTSGGILSFVPKVRADDCVSALKAAGYMHASVIGSTSDIDGIRVL